MDYKTILVDSQPPLCILTLNRPERRNAMTPEMQTELLHALPSIAAMHRVLILTGAGSAFCSGLDLSVLQTMHERSAEDHRADAERIAQLFRTLYELPIPTIAAVHGPAIAGGTGLATLCDFTLATQDAKFGYTEARIGFVPALVSAFLAVQVGDKIARDLLLTARLFDSAEAHRLGLVNAILAHDDLMPRARALAKQLIANSPQSLAGTKRLLAAQNKPFLDAAIDYALAANADARTTADFREGIAAFLEKRPPHWSK